MTSGEAVQLVRERFPFDGYMCPNDKMYLDIANTVLRYLQPGSKVLDFGSGPCDKTAVIQALGFKCSGYDDLQDYWHKIDGNRDKIIAFARKLGIDFKLAGNGHFPFKKDSFDMLMMHDILEHLHDSPRDLLNDLMAIVRPEGYLFVTVPNAVNIRKRIAVLFGKTNLPPFESYYWYPGSWRGHVREYTKGDLKKLCEYLNLDISELHGCHHMLERVPEVICPLYVGITGVFRGWRDSWLLVAKKRKDWASRKTLSKEELKEMLSRVSAYRY